MTPQPGGARLTPEQRLDWLRLIRCEGIGPRTFRGLLNHCGGAAAALDALPDLARKRAGRAIRITSRTDALRELDALERIGARLIALGEPDYPAPLRATDDAPPLIAVRGRASLLTGPCVAVVGSRNASAAKLRFTTSIAADLGRAGYAIVSGLARGIDAKAHAASLASGTVAVLAGGHDKLYPAEHAALLASIVEEGGAVVTEMPMGWEPRGRDFPRRNRIVSGLSLGVLVVEAARRSGSLITARFALEQGREVFAVPGSPLDPRAEGPNDLIRQGATLVGCAEHVTSVLAPLSPEGVQPERRLMEADGQAESLWDEMDLLDASPLAPIPATPLSDHPWTDAPLDDGQGAQPAPDRRDAILSRAPVGTDDLARIMSCPMRELQPVLLELEIEGRLTRHPHGLVLSEPADAENRSRDASPARASPPERG